MSKKRKTIGEKGSAYYAALDIDSAKLKNRQQYRKAVIRARLRKILAES